MVLRAELSQATGFRSPTQPSIRSCAREPDVLPDWSLAVTAVAATEQHARLIADCAAGAAVLRIGVEVRANAAALGLAFGTLARAGDALFPAAARVAASTAVRRIDL